MMNIRPMLAKAGDLPLGDGWNYEPKYDGFRCMIRVNKDGVAELFVGRNAVPLPGLPYITTPLAAVLPVDTIVDGELHSAEGWGNVAQVVKRLQGNTDEHVPSDESPALEFVAFDVLRVDGDDYTSTPFRGRRERLELLGIPVAPQHRGPDAQAYVDGLLDEGWEGVMAKHDDGLYLTGRIDSKGEPKSQRAKADAMVKVKPQHTIDVVVLSVEDPEPGSWLDDEGLPGALVYGYVDGEPVGHVGTGFTRAMRQDIRDNADDPWVGSVIEIGHMTVDKNAKRPRHPAFIRRRPDKAAADCKEAT